jgi:23S rRNA (cytidine1920-2'-O)/16S rRNA (cytidine1409-2'-O)-methyltransferase
MLTDRGLAESRNRAQALILAGKVRVDTQVVTKPGTQVSTEAAITVEEENPYVSRGGFKLAAALDEFEIEPRGTICADVGASTGGFTDVLLQRGAARVYAIDVGYGQLAWKLRSDARLVVMERTNVRYLEALPEPINLITVDVSFISLRLILPVVAKWLTIPGELVTLIKPQFEAGRNQVSKGGIIREKAVHCQVLENIINAAIERKFCLLGLIPSPILGPAGNREFLAYFGWHTARTPIQAEAAIQSCLSGLYPSE